MVYGEVKVCGMWSCLFNYPNPEDPSLFTFAPLSPIFSKSNSIPIAVEKACDVTPLCQNGGTCVQNPTLLEEYTCSCVSGYGGDNCEIGE